MNDPITKPHPSRNLEILTEPWHVKILDLEFTIKKGFMWDGASIPRAFWITTGSSFMPKYRAAACVHDFLYRTGIVSRKTADKIFYIMLKSRKDVGRYTAWKMHRGVRAGGWVSWKRYRKRSIDWQREYLEN